MSLIGLFVNSGAVAVRFLKRQFRRVLLEIAVHW